MGLEVVDYAEQPCIKAAKARPSAYVECKTPDDRRVYGVGIDSDIATASIKAVLSGGQCSASLGTIAVNADFGYIRLTAG